MSENKLSQKLLPKNVLIMMVLFNIVWATNPTLSKILMRHFAPFQVAVFRYGFALISFWILSLFLKKVPLFLWTTKAKISTKTWLQALTLGFFTFCFSPLFQMQGLSNTRATDNTLIIAMEPLVAAFLAWLFLNQTFGKMHIFAFTIALIGFFLLIGIGPSQVLEPFDFSTAKNSLKGNLFILISLLGEGFFSVLSYKLIKNFHPISVFGTMLLIGLFFTIIITLYTEGMPNLSLLTYKDFACIFVLGFVGTTLGYIYWIFQLAKVPIASLSITIFVQPLVGSLLGFFVLDERLTFIQFLGGALILLSVLSVTKYKTPPKLSNTA
ncbi:MAG: EamA family transporter [Bdellovibrio sp.]|nr:EamA family transporter [Bdellovibrio sp.]